MTYEIRATSLGGVLDTAFRLVRNHFVPLVGIGLAVSLPAQVLTDLVTTGMGPDPDAQIIAGAIAMALLMLLVSPIVSAAVTHAVSEAYLGRSVDMVASLRVGLRLLLPLVGTALLMTLLEAIGFLLLIIPGIYLALAWMLTYQVMVIEHRAGWNALQRTRTLSSGHLLRVLGVFVVAMILMVVLSGVVQFVLPDVPVLPTVVAGAVQAVFNAYISAALVVLYFDIRCRKEAFDLEHLANVVSAEGAPRPVPIG